MIVKNSKREPNTKYISIGKTSIYSMFENAIDKSVLGLSGFNILTKDQHIILYGNREESLLFAVYELLSILFNLEVYGEDIYSYNSEITDIKLEGYKITVAPKIQIKTANYGYLHHTVEGALKLFARRLRVEGLYDHFISLNGISHNSTKVIDVETYYNLHPKWFANEQGTQLSYNAHGDEIELELLVEEVTNKMKVVLITNPKQTMIAFTQADNQDWDQSIASRISYEKYGTDAAVVIQFMNRVREKIDIWFSGSGASYKRDLIIYFFAYLNTEKPPVKLEAGVYVPMDDSVVLREGVAPWIAPLVANYNQGFEHISNINYMETIKGWQALSTNSLLWTYSSNFNHYLVPFDSFDSMESIYNMAHETGAYLYFDQAQHNTTQPPTGWSKLKIYLNSKLAWNPMEDTNVLTDNFFTHYFGPAKTNMLNWFNDWKAHSNMLKDIYPNEYTGNNSVFKNLLNTKFFPKDKLELWQKYARNAMLDIAYLENEKIDLYQKYSDNIMLELISLEYLLIELYGDTFDHEVRSQMIEQFFDKVSNFDITKLNETTSISTLYEKWNI